MIFFLAATASNAAPRSAAAGKAIVIGESGARWTGEPISLDLKDADLVDVLMSFSKIAKENVVVDPGVRGSVTVRLRDVPWDQALDLIVRMNGYAVARGPRILRIGRPAALAR